jgi:diaminopimelate decarboxylase/aspartate kinase
VDLVSTSETSVTVSLDPAANSLDREILADLVTDLQELCRVQVIGPCASLSLVGRNIRGILHKLGEAFELFEEQKIYLVSQAANDLNFTFVIDEDQGDRLVEQLHDLLIRPGANDKVMGPTWEQLSTPNREAPRRPPVWWERRREELLAIGQRHACAYVYDGETVDACVRAVKELSAIDRVLYSVKANPHAELLRRMEAQGISFECVSQGEVEHVRRSLPGLDPQRILFTPNFAPREEYAFGLEQGVWVTLDNLHPLRHWGELFRGREVFLRIDPGFGRGHHHHVRTAGRHSKFGVPLFELSELSELVKSSGVKIVGLHAHTGSGIFNVANWAETASLLCKLPSQLPELSGVRYIDVGGGIGVPERPQQETFNLRALDAELRKVRDAFPKLGLFMEPGRFLVAQSGVLLARVTQLKGKGDVLFVGVATGMNSLIRPALYGAYHEIVNLTRLGEPATRMVNIVGPICESGDQLGHDRPMPETHEGDVLLIANTGAYGRSMSSFYNLREPAPEIVI